MQQITMTTGTGKSALTPIAYAMQRGQRYFSKDADFAKVMAWMCDTGVMTDSIYAVSGLGDALDCATLAYDRELTKTAAVLRSWKELPDNERRERTLLRFPHWLRHIAQTKVVTLHTKESATALKSGVSTLQ